MWGRLPAAQRRMQRLNAGLRSRSVASLNSHRVTAPEPAGSYVVHQCGPSMGGQPAGTRQTEAAQGSAVTASISGDTGQPHSSGLPARAAQAAQAPVPVPPATGVREPHNCHGALAGAALAPCLFAMPVESNFSGQRYDLALVQQVQQQGLACRGAAPSGGRCPPSGCQDPATPVQQQAMPGCLAGRQSSDAPVQGKGVQGRPAGSQSTAVPVQGQGLLRHPVACSGCTRAPGGLLEGPDQAEGSGQAEQDGSSQPGRSGQAPIEQVCPALGAQRGTERDSSTQAGHPLETPSRQQPGGAQGDLCRTQQEGAAQQPGRASITQPGTQQKGTAQQPGETSGAQHGTQQEGAAQQRWLVLLDAAKACGTAPPDLSRHPADFVVSPSAPRRLPAT